MALGIATTAELPFMDVDFGLRDSIRFSYARPEDPLLRKAIIRAV